MALLETNFFSMKGVLFFVAIITQRSYSDDDICATILSRSSRNLCGSLTSESTWYKEFICKNAYPWPTFNSSCCVLPDCTISIDLTGSNVSDSSFTIYHNEMEKNLKYMTINDNQRCGLGEESWSTIKQHGGVKICSKPNACTNITCPDNSHCIVNGSVYECHCDEGWHGYKCLKYKTFPTEAWLISIGASTFGVISILWSYQKYSLVKRKRYSATSSQR